MVKHEIHITIMVTLLAFLFLCLWRPLPSSSLIGHDVKQIFISSCHKLLELFIPRVPPKQSQFQETRTQKLHSTGLWGQDEQGGSPRESWVWESEFSIFPHGVLPVPPKTVSQSHQPVSCVELTGNMVKSWSMWRGSNQNWLRAMGIQLHLISSVYLLHVVVDSMCLVDFSVVHANSTDSSATPRDSCQSHCFLSMLCWISF